MRTTKLLRSFLTIPDVIAIGPAADTFWTGTAGSDPLTWSLVRTDGKPLTRQAAQAADRSRELQTAMRAGATPAVDWTNRVIGLQYTTNLADPLRDERHSKMATRATVTVPFSASAPISSAPCWQSIPASPWQAIPPQMSWDAWGIGRHNGSGQVERHTLASGRFAHYPTQEQADRAAAKLNRAADRMAA